MTQHQKCDYSVTPENVCSKFCTFSYQTHVHEHAIFSEITLLFVHEIGITLNYKVRILQLNIVICYVAAMRQKLVCNESNSLSGSHMWNETEKK